MYAAFLELFLLQILQSKGLCCFITRVKSLLFSSFCLWQSVVSKGAECLLYKHYNYIGRENGIYSFSRWLSSPLQSDIFLPQLKCPSLGIRE